MIELIDKQLSFLQSELDNGICDTGRILELMKILELFKEVFTAVINPINDNSRSAVVEFILQFVNLKGKVDFVELLDEFLDFHNLKQVDVAGKSNIYAVQVSNFLNRKHSMQSNNLEKLLNYR